MLYVKAGSRMRIPIQNPGRFHRFTARGTRSLAAVGRRSSLHRILYGILLAGLALCASSCTEEAEPPTPIPTDTQQAATEPSAPGIEGILVGLDGYSCVDGSFTCVDLPVPLDHTDPADDRTITVTFAVHPASGHRKGMLVIAVGGPGGSGLAVADWYVWSYDPAITAQFDIVLFDTRGVGASGDLRCDEAMSTSYQEDWDPSTDEGLSAYRASLEVTSPEGKEGMLADSQAFAEACVKEVAYPDLLPFVGTEQAIEDLELFRKAIGDDKLWLLGESYGSYFAQAYTTAHADHVAGLILDGPVDPATSPLDFLAEQTRAFNDVLVMTLEACSADYYCHEDMGGDALAAYDALAERLAAAPAAFDFPLASGGVESRYFGLQDLETAAGNYMYSEFSRMIFLRALAAAVSRDDFVPLARILYDALSVDPDTFYTVYDPSFSDVSFYAIECNDSDLTSVEGYLQAGEIVAETTPRFASGFFSNLVCLFWPRDPFPRPVPPPLVAEGIPTLLLVGTADPATPPVNARRILEHLADGYLILEEGGPHVLFGWGKPCIDTLVTNFLVRDKVPAQRETTCPGVVAAEYFSLPPLDASEFDSPLEALWSVDVELSLMPDLYYWDGERDLSIGCPSGGSLSVKASFGDDLYVFENCTFTPGFSLTGSGFYDMYEGNFNLDLEVSGYEQGHLYYDRDASWNLLLTGEYGGREIKLRG